MNVTTRTAEQCEVVVLKGRLDLAGADIAEKHMKELRMRLAPGSLVVVNLSGVEYISSSGLRVVIATFKEIQAKGGEMVLAQMNPAVEEVFRFAGLDTVFRIFPSEAEALLALAQR